MKNKKKPTKIIYAQYGNNIGEQIGQYNQNWKNFINTPNSPKFSSYLDGFLFRNNLLGSGDLGNTHKIYGDPNSPYYNPQYKADEATNAQNINYVETYNQAKANQNGNYIPNNQQFDEREYGDMNTTYNQMNEYNQTYQGFDKNAQLLESLSGVMALMKGQKNYDSKQKETYVPKYGSYGNMMYQLGGTVNTQGYTPGAPSFDNSFNIIPSNKITMKNTPFQVLGIPNVGKPVIMKPGKDYKFKNADYVTEIPMYQYGGEVQPQSEPKYIQAEIGEYIELPDGSLHKVKAEKRHKQMEKDEITDQSPDGSYIYSNDPKMKIDLNYKMDGVKIRDFNLGYSITDYKEGEIIPGPKKILFADKFTGNKLTPAEMAAQLNKTFSTKVIKDDVFSKETSKENLEHRREYLEIVKALNEYMKPANKPMKAQFGGMISSVFNQPYNNAVDGMMKFTDRLNDPYYGMDNAMKGNNFLGKSMTGFSPKLPKMQDGGEPYKQGLFDNGQLFDYVSPIGLISKVFADRKVNKESKRRWEEYNSYISERNKLQEDQYKNTMLFSLAKGAIPTPNKQYLNLNSQFSTLNNVEQRNNIMLNANRYNNIGLTGSLGSMARYTNPSNNAGIIAQAMSSQNTIAGGANTEAMNMNNAYGNIRMGLYGQLAADKQNTKYLNDTVEYGKNLNMVGEMGNNINAKNQISQNNLAVDLNARENMRNASMNYGVQLANQRQNMWNQGINLASNLIAPGAGSASGKTGQQNSIPYQNAPAYQGEMPWPNMSTPPFISNQGYTPKNPLGNWLTKNAVDPFGIIYGSMYNNIYKTPAE